MIAVRSGWAALACLTILSTPSLPARAEQTVTLTPRQFAASSSAAPFTPFFADARRLAATTTPAWHTVDNDLSAWGPALIFASLDRGVSSDTVRDLAAPLTAEGTAPTLMFRTLGLYAAKNRTPFLDTPALRQAIDRNLGTLEHATADLDTFTEGPETKGWGSIGAGAWLAYLELLYRNAFDLGDPGARRWNADGLRILDSVIQRGQLPDGAGFRRDPRDAQIALWPTALAIYGLVQAYENEEAVRYESAARAAAAALEPLRDADGSYFSTAAKSAKEPRANAYLAGALLLLSKNTGDAQYRDRALAILVWLTTGSAAKVVTADPSLSTHVGYLALLLDSLSTQAAENVLGRRPMRLAAELGAGLSASAVDELAKRLRPADFRYRALVDGLLHTLIERVPYTGGDFAYDYGDAPGYAAAVLDAAGERTIPPQIVTREERLIGWPHPRDFDEISFGADALLAASNDAAGAAAQSALRRYLLLSGGIAFADRYYLDWLDWFTGGGGFEYGPTVLGAQIAATHLEYASRFPNQRVAGVLSPLAVARGLLAETDRVAWNASTHTYRARAASDGAALLPNAMMILDLLQAHEISGDAAYLARAEEVAGGLEALWDERHGAYFASSAQSGDDAYESLSTNSYAAWAHLRLYAATQKPAYHERALRIFDWMNRDLYGGGILFHHVHRGRRAAGDIWCTGCNWRVLRVLTELAGLDRQ